MAGPLKCGGEGRVIKDIFFLFENKGYFTAIKLGEGGGYALMARPLRKYLFSGFPKYYFF